MRRKPAIFTAVGVLEFGQALAVTVIFMGILVTVIYLINISDPNKLTTALLSPRNWIPIFLVLLGFIVYPVIMVIVGMKGIFQAISNYIEKRIWIKTNRNIQVPIIDRSREYNEYAETKEQEWACSLRIRIPSESDNDASDHDIEVSVSNHIYSIYENKEVARIFYAPDDPLTFIFEGE